MLCVCVYLIHLRKNTTMVILCYIVVTVVDLSEILITSRSKLLLLGKINFGYKFTARMQLAVVQIRRQGQDESVVT